MVEVSKNIVSLVTDHLCLEYTIRLKDIEATSCWDNDARTLTISFPTTTPGSTVESDSDGLVDASEHHTSNEDINISLEMFSVVVVYIDSVTSNRGLKLAISLAPELTKAQTAAAET